METEEEYTSAIYLVRLDFNDFDVWVRRDDFLFAFYFFDYCRVFGGGGGVCG